jgi:hypothetical protein
LNVPAREDPTYSIYGVSLIVLFLEGSRGFSASCSSTLPTLPASVIDIVLVPHAWADNGAFNSLSSMASIAGCSREYVPATAKLTMVSGKAIEEKSVEFGCVEGEVEEGRRSGGVGGGNGAHLGLSFRQGRPRNRRSMRAPFQGLLAYNPLIFFPRLISAEQPLSNRKWDSYPQCHHTGNVPASYQVRDHSPPSQF